MNARITRPLVLIISATFVAMILVRVAGTLFAWYVIPSPRAHHFARLAWVELGLEATVIVSGSLAVWRVLRREREEDRQRLHRDHLATVGTLASGLAHEMRNYLNAMRTHVALLRKMATADGQQCEKCGQRIDRLEQTTSSLEELLADFLTFARPLEDRLEEIHIDELFREVAEFVSLDFEQANVRLQLDIDSGVPSVHADTAKLKRAILNLLVNARQAISDGGVVTVRVIGKDDSVVIEIADTGCGISEENRARLFESFFSTKSGGVGLGLAIVKRTIEDLSGSIDFESIVGRGTTFRITLPSSSDARSPLLERPNGQADASGLGS
ncbi:MAG: hypothetical protein JW818_07690 [Pirellulales bacterium]|nr:hypothetical protein [Pirellulales bacterium]